MNIAKCLSKISGSGSKINIINNIAIRNYAFKSDLKIKWVRPEKIPCHKPAASGDLTPMPKIDTKQYQVDFRDCKALQDADELVQRLFTLEFAPHSKIMQSYIQDISSNVQRHLFDKSSVESKIAQWTGAIRAMQEIIEEHPRNRRLKVKLKELIDKRKKHLKYLRKWDYKKFEWLLENLNIVYKPAPTEYFRVTRKDSLRKLTQEYCDDMVKEKLNTYKLVLQEQQPAFLEEKIRSLEFIRNEQENCGIEVTVTEEEINNVKQQLVDLLKQKDTSVKED